MIVDSTLIKETKIYKLSTQSSSGLCLNDDTNYKSSFKYTFPVVNLHEEDIEFVYMSIPYVCLPVSFYNIDYQNNRLDMIINGVSASYLFKSGNYNSITFISQFQALLGTGWTLTLDKITNCFTIVNSINAFQTFSILGTSTISSVLGFSQTLASSPTIGFNSSYLTLPRTCNFLPIPRIHLRCKELSHSCLISKNCESDILVSVPNDSPLNGKIVYRNFMNSANHLDLPFLQSLTINFTDEQNNFVNFNGISSYFEIQLDIYKKRPNRAPSFWKVIQELSRILE